MDEPPLLPLEMASVALNALCLSSSCYPRSIRCQHSSSNRGKLPLVKLALIVLRRKTGNYQEPPQSALAYLSGLFLPLLTLPIVHVHRPALQICNYPTDSPIAFLLILYPFSPKGHSQTFLWHCLASINVEISTP